MRPRPSAGSPGPERLFDAMGGVAATQSFYRYYVFPNATHCGGAGMTEGVLLGALTSWVENGVAPDYLVAQVNPTRTRGPISPRAQSLVMMPSPSGGIVGATWPVKARARRGLSASRRRWRIAACLHTAARRDLRAPRASPVLPARRRPPPTAPTGPAWYMSPQPGEMP